MKQATALYGSTDNSEPEAIGTAITMLKDDLSDFERSWSVFQATVMGDRGAYSVEFTLQVPDYTEPTFEKAEDSEVLV
jgi:hypothetical protein